MAEAMLLGKPVDRHGLLGQPRLHDAGELVPRRLRLTPVGDGTDPYPADGEWAEPDLDHAAALMRRVFEDRDEAARRARRGHDDVARGTTAGAAARHGRSGSRPRTRAPAASAVSRRRAARPTSGRRRRPPAGPRVRSQRTARPLRAASAPRGPARDAARTPRGSAHRPSSPRACTTRVLAGQVSRHAGSDDECAILRAAARLALAARAARAAGNGRRAARRGARAHGRRAARAARRARRRDGPDGRERGRRPDARDGAGTAARRYPPAPAEPWSHDYNDAHARVRRRASSTTRRLLPRFRDGEALPDGFGRGYDERVVEFPWVLAAPLGGRAARRRLHAQPSARPRVASGRASTSCSSSRWRPRSARSPSSTCPTSTRTCATCRCATAPSTAPLDLDVRAHRHEQRRATAATRRRRRTRSPRPSLRRGRAAARRPPGRQLYMTVPVGRGERFPWVRTFTLDELDELVAAFRGASSARRSTGTTRTDGGVRRAPRCRRGLSGPLLTRGRRCERLRRRRGVALRADRDPGVTA